MLVYGKNVAISYLSKPNQINQINLIEGFNDEKIINLIKKNKIKYQYLSKIQFNTLVKSNHQGIILDVNSRESFSLDDLLSDKTDQIVVVLDHIEDPHNLGAIIRTCEAAGIKNIIIPNKRAAGIDGVVYKTSAGAISDINIIIVSNLVDAINKLKNSGYWVVGCDMTSNIKYSDHQYDNKTLLIIGSESKGMSRLVSESCDYIVHIPMHGKINSLNASVAAGIIIFDAIK